MKTLTSILFLLYSLIFISCGESPVGNPEEKTRGITSASRGTQPVDVEVSGFDMVFNYTGNNPGNDNISEIKETLAPGDTLQLTSAWCSSAFITSTGPAKLLLNYGNSVIFKGIYLDGADLSGITITNIHNSYIDIDGFYIGKSSDGVISKEK